MGRRHGRPNGGDPGSGLALSNHCQTEPDHRRQGRQDGCSYNCEQKIIAIGLAQTGIRLAELWNVFSYSNTILGEVSERALRRYEDLGSKAFETKSFCSGQNCTLRMSAHHVPVIGIDTQGSGQNCTLRTDAGAKAANSARQSGASKRSKIEASSFSGLFTRVESADSKPSSRISQACA